MNKKAIGLVLTGLLLLPVYIFAQVSADKPTEGSLNIGTLMKGISNLVWQFFAGLSVVMFVIAGVLFLTSNGDPGKIATARNAFLWGVVGVIVAIFAFSAITIISGAIRGGA